MADLLKIFDTTMRDGEQSPGASMTLDEKVRIAKQLEKMKVDVIEAGFPAASIGDFESVAAVARTIRDSIVCGLARATESDIKRVSESLFKNNYFGQKLHFMDSYLKNDSELTEIYVAKMF